MSKQDECARHLGFQSHAAMVDILDSAIADCDETIALGDEVIALLKSA